MFYKLLSTRYVLTAAALALLLAACSGQSNTTKVPTTAPAASTAAPAATTAAPTTAPAAPAAATTASNTAVAKINLNTATAEQILTVPNASNRMVREFQEYRPYASITEFRKAIGKYVDAAQVSDYEKYVYVPVSPNNADAATLQQLPGVDAAKADQLIAARPYADKAAFIQKLTALTSAEQTTSAAAMVEAQ